MRMIYYALLFGLFSFCLIVLFLYLNDGMQPFDEFLKNTYLGVLAVLSIGSFLFGNVIFKRKIQATSGKVNLFEKMADYRSATILRYAIIEGPAFFAIILSFVTGDLLFLGIGTLIIAYLFTLKPTMERAIKDLELSHKEQDLLSDPNAVIAEIMVGR